MVEIPFRRSKNGIILNVRVEPRSSRTMIAGTVGETLKVKLTSPPVDGAANKQLIEVLSDFFHVRKKAIRIISGKSARNKVVEISGIEEP
jgi:uncharacterized protein (TIGR00251 family)